MLLVIGDRTYTSSSFICLHTQQILLPYYELSTEDMVSKITELLTP